MRWQLISAFKLAPTTNNQEPTTNKQQPTTNNKSNKSDKNHKFHIKPQDGEKWSR